MAKYTDAAAKLTDRRLTALERRMAAYCKSRRAEIQALVKELLGDFKQLDERWKQAVEDGDMTEAEYKQKKQEYLIRSKRAKDIRRRLAKLMTEMNRYAAEQVNAVVIQTFIDNANFALYQYEGLIGSG